MPERITDLGVERKCSRCREWWPRKLDYFHNTVRPPNGRVQWQSWCRACVAEQTRAKRKRLKRKGART